MKQHIEELLGRIRAMQEEVEEEYRKAIEEFEARRFRLAGEFLRQQRRYKIGSPASCAARACRWC